MTETDTGRNVVDFKRRPINEWPKHIYLADFGGGEGTRTYTHIQRPDDTTPQYVRGDLYDALLARVEQSEVERDAAWNDAIEAAAARIEDLGFSANLIRTLKKGEPT